MSIIAKCSDCGEVLSELVNFTENHPCPHCGSLSMQIIDDDKDEFKLREKLVIKVRRDDERKPIEKIIKGDDLFRKTGKWNLLERIFDYENDWYSEKITDPLTGDIIHSCEEPLSEHTDHGDAKYKKR
jgi:hypothetical protein